MSSPLQLSCFMFPMVEIGRPSFVFGGWVAMLNRAGEFLGHGYSHAIRLIIPVFKPLPSYECTVWKMDLPPALP
jgi:hypothetical protein